MSGLSPFMFGCLSFSTAADAFNFSASVIVVRPGSLSFSVVVASMWFVGSSSCRGDVIMLAAARSFSDIDTLGCDDLSSC